MNTKTLRELKHELDKLTELEQNGKAFKNWEEYQRYLIKRREVQDLIGLALLRGETL